MIPVVLLALLVSFSLSAAFAGETFRGSRGPANFIPDDELEPPPVEQKIWLQSLLIEDDAGVLMNIKRDIEAWEELEEWRELWNVESTGLYFVPNADEKKSYLERMLIRYADKRLAGEVRRAEKGSTLHQVGQVQKALKPKAEVGISEKIKVKIRGKVLQGLVVVNVNNPWVDSYANVKVDGQVDVHINRKVASLGVDAGIDYDVSAGAWEARVDRRITSTVSARISSSHKDDRMVFTEDADNRIQLFFNKPF